MDSSRHQTAAVILHESFGWHVRMITCALDLPPMRVWEWVEEHRAALRAEAEARRLAALPVSRVTTVVLEAGGSQADEWRRAA